LLVDTEAYRNRGFAKKTKGDFEGAKADYQKVLEFIPGDLNAEKNLDEINGKLAKP
jgi:hypothetical protein